MEQPTPTRWPRRAFFALFCSLLLLAMTLPSTGGIIADPQRHPDMWRCGPILFSPRPFFTIVGSVTTFTSCIVLGIKRQNDLEIIGWILMGTFFICVFLGVH